MMIWNNKITAKRKREEKLHRENMGEVKIITKDDPEFQKIAEECTRIQDIKSPLPKPSTFISAPIDRKRTARSERDSTRI